MEKVLEVKNIAKYYGNRSNLTKAIDGLTKISLMEASVGLATIISLKRKNRKKKTSI